MSEVLDVVIVGAGISGINAAQRVQTQMPGCKYTILEARDTLGGTWSLFKYPGIRSDSDLFTFGFSWRPWGGNTRFASGEEIFKYMKESAEEYGIDKKIQYGMKVTSLAFSTAKALWTITTESSQGKRTLTAKFVILGTGYYDYHKPLDADVAGIDNFKGQVIHPQFWPEDFEAKDKKIVIIGSGATAVTLLPNLAKLAAHVTMLQRSPSYVMMQPNSAAKYPRWLPSPLKLAANYLRYLILPFLFFNFCRTFPNAARNLIRGVTSKQLPASIPHDPHFNPRYNPWEQRLCMSPDGDFFESMRMGKANVATGTIKTMSEKSITLTSGQEIEADVVVTATGLKLQMAGGAEITVDGDKVVIGDRYIWRGIMLENVPNCAFVIGYTNASWTLGADCTALYVCRLFRELERRHAGFVVPRTAAYSDLAPADVLNLSSTYITKNKKTLPKAGNVGPWRARANYFKDFYTAKFGNLTEGLEYV